MMQSMHASRAAVRQGVATVLIAIHSFTPVYFGNVRLWQVGIVFDEEACMANALISGLTADPALTVGVNEPYSSADLVLLHGQQARAPAWPLGGHDRDSQR